VKRVTGIKLCGQWDASSASDRVVLDAGDRNRRRIALSGEKGTQFLLDLAKPAALRDGDGLLLDDGSIVLVAGEAEALVEVSAGSGLDTVRLAWHLGNRHTDVQIAGAKLRIRRDHVLEEMLRGLGAHLAPLEAPFDPEQGAPHGHHGHDHGA
jgi:urease accessory protein